MTLGELFERYRGDRRTEGKKGVAGLIWTWERYLGALPAAEKKKHGAERTKAPGSVNWQTRPIKEISHEDVARVRLDRRKDRAHHGEPRPGVAPGDV